MADSLRWRAQTFLANQDAIVVTDLDGRIIDWNPASERMFGYTRAEALGQKTAILHAPDPTSAALETIFDVMAREGLWHGEFTFVTKDRSRGVAESTVTPLLDEEGNRIGAFGVNRDVTQRKRLEEEHARSLARAETERARLRAILDVLPAGVAIYDESGELQELNPEGQRLTRRAVEEGETPAARQLRYAMRRADGSPIREEESPSGRSRRGETFAELEYIIDGSHGPETHILTSGAPLPPTAFPDRSRTEDEGFTGCVVVFQDVTELRRLERALADRVTELEGIFEAMTSAVVLFDAEARILRVNKAARDLYTRAAGPNAFSLPFAERLMNQKLVDEHGAPLPAERWPAARILAGESILSGSESDIWFVTRDGETLNMNLNGVPLRDPDGIIVGGIAIYQDVTERRNLERRTRRALEALLEMAQMLVTLPDDQPRGKSLSLDVERASAGGAATGEWNAERLVAQRIAALTCDVLGCKRVGITAITPETEQLRAVAVVGLPPEQEERWWTEQREIERQGVRLGDGADPGELARFRDGEVFVLDMTEPRFRDLPNPYGVTTQLIAPMRAGNRLVGMLSLDYGGPPHQFTPDEVALSDAVAQLGAVALERERLLRERAEAQAAALALEDANRRMDEFLGIASHELRTPLTSIQANVQLIDRRLRRYSDGSPAYPASAPLSEDELRERLGPLALLIQRTDRQIARLNRLVGDLLDVSRIQAGKLDFSFESCDLAALTREAVEEQRATWPGRAITCATPRQVAIDADRDRVGQVVTNYLTNALKYSAPGEPVSVRVTVANGMARVQVRDHGQGIARKHQARLFERFYRAPGVEQQSGSGVGLGLGLHICKTIVERHGGQVGVESAPGKGSTFWFTLPVAGGQSSHPEE